MPADFSIKVPPSLKFDCMKRVGDQVLLPPCRLSDVVVFVDGKCPYSGESDCRDCISNEFELECVNTLRCSDFNVV
jgi:hypothetical protein